MVWKSHWEKNNALFLSSLSGNNSKGIQRQGRFLSCSVELYPCYMSVLSPQAFREPSVVDRRGSLYCSIGLSS
jgi:hypothetical protein